MADALPRRFYKTATVTEDGVGVLLDERRLKTPRGAALASPTRVLAEVIAGEWDAQGEYISPAAMPVSQLAFAAIDVTPARRADLIAYVAKYGETDLVCHRADAPASLVARQSAVWEPLVAWAASDLGALLPVVTGILPATPNREALETLGAHAAACDDFDLTALAQATGLAGSVVIAFALLRGRLDAESAFTAATLDDAWSIENWGEDAEAVSRLKAQRAEFAAIAAFVAALKTE